MINVKPYEKAVEAVSEAFGPILGTEMISVCDSVGRICAEDIASEEDVPCFDRSTVDGYAVSSAETNAASVAGPSVFDLCGEAVMGEPNIYRAGGGRCVYVPTGAMLPEGSDAVAMIEDAERRGKEILLTKPLRVCENVARKGEDVRRGAAIVRRGQTIGAGGKGALLAAGITRISVVTRPSYYVISTGDELVAPSDPCPVGKVRDINAELVHAATPLWNFAGAERCHDDPDALKAAVTRALDVADIVVMSGGSSVGTADYTERLFAGFGEVFLHGIAVKPGKPTLAAKCGDKLLIGLPGHPMAAFSSFKLVFERAFVQAAGAEFGNVVFARAKVNFAGGAGRTCVMPVKLIAQSDGFLAEPLFYKSGMVSVLAQCDGFAVIPDYEEGVNRGDCLKIYRI